MKGIAVSHGAATIINAIATGRGGAFGIDLKTKATVNLNDSGKITAEIKDSPEEDTKLIEICARKVFRHFEVYYGAHIKTESEIPIAKGLKSSSVAANAVVLATMEAVRNEKSVIIPRDELIVKLGVEAAIDSNVTITGAYDDACASYFGGIVITDNDEKRIVKQKKIEPMKVLLFVPDKKMYTKDVDVEKTRLLKNEIMLAWKEALRGEIYMAMNLNGILYSSLLNQNPEIALTALEKGAIAAGLCGKGPAVAALVKGNTNDIREGWEQFNGEIIETRTNNEKAEVL